MTDHLVWIDCEMTGLDLARDALVEIACVVTDSELAPVDGGIDLVIKPPAEALDSMPEVVREMHTASGLLTELAGGVTLAEAQEQILAHLRAYLPPERKVPLCGNSIATDRAVTITPRTGTLRSVEWFGERARSVSSESTSTR